MRLALIDLDGVICNSEARFAKASEAKAAYLATQNPDNHYVPQVKTAADNIYWRTAFTPALVELDTLIDGADQALDQIKQDYDIYFLTSRPESMREATAQWIHEHLHSFSWRFELKRPSSSLIMKPDSQKFVKTVVWKAGIVELLVRLFGVDELLFIDDEPAHCESVESLDLPCDRIICGSLQEAVNSLEKEN